MTRFTLPTHRQLSQLIAHLKPLALHKGNKDHMIGSDFQYVTLEVVLGAGIDPVVLLSLPSEVYDGPEYINYHDGQDLVGPAQRVYVFRREALEEYLNEAAMRLNPGRPETNGKVI